MKQKGPNVLFLIYCSGPPNVFYERWLNINGSTIDELVNNPRYPNDPNISQYQSQMFAKHISRNNFGSRYRSYFQASETGNYTFFTSCDDTCRLFQSPDVNPVHRRQIVDQNKDVPRGQWNTR